MRSSLLIVTHGRLGRYLIDTVSEMLNGMPFDAEVLEVRRVQDPDALVRQGERAIARMNKGAGVLVLTDAYGSTPANIATRITANGDCKVVAGVNLPMLIRICNYPDLPLDELAETAVAGGRRGIMLCEE